MWITPLCSIRLDLDFICKDVFLVEKEDHGGLFEEAIVANGSEEFERFVKSAITIKASKLGCFNIVKSCYCLLNYLSYEKTRYILSNFKLRAWKYDVRLTTKLFDVLAALFFHFVVYELLTQMSAAWWNHWDKENVITITSW